MAYGDDEPKSWRKHVMWVGAVGALGIMVKIGMIPIVASYFMAPSAEEQLEQLFNGNEGNRLVSQALLEADPDRMAELRRSLIVRIEAGASEAALIRETDRAINVLVAQARGQIAQRPMPLVREILLSEAAVMAAAQRAGPAFCREQLQQLQTYEELPAELKLAIAQRAAAYIRASSLRLGAATATSPSRPNSSDLNALIVAMGRQGVNRAEAETAIVSGTSAIPESRQCVVSKILFDAVSTLPEAGMRRIAHALINPS